MKQASFLAASLANPFQQDNRIQLAGYIEDSFAPGCKMMVTEQQKYMKNLQYSPIDQSLINQVSQQATASDRSRMNYNFHQPEDPAQRFLNAIEPGSYVQPHRHQEPSRDETFIILRGRGSVIIFNDQGDIEDCLILNPEAGNFGIHIPGGIFHSILSLEKGSVFFEVKPGPYVPAVDKDFAPWAPEENTRESTVYLKNLEKIALLQQ